MSFAFLDEVGIDEICQRVINECRTAEDVVRTKDEGTVDFAAVQAAVEGPQVILDVRTKLEVEGYGFIKGSIHVPLREVEAALALEAAEFKSKYGSDKPDEATEIITHCMVGGRAQKAADALVAKGFSNVKVYKGSFDDWRKRGGEIIMPEVYWLQQPT